MHNATIQTTTFSELDVYVHWKTIFEKTKLVFCVGEYAEYGFDQQRLIWYVCRDCSDEGLTLGGNVS